MPFLRTLARRPPLGMSLVLVAALLLLIGYQAYETRGTVEYDRHGLLFATALGVLIRGSKWLRTASVRSELSEMELASACFLGAGVGIHWLAGVTDNGRWLEWAATLLGLLILLRTSLQPLFIAAYWPCLLVPFVLEAGLGLYQWGASGWQAGLSVRGTFLNSGTLANYLASCLPLVAVLASVAHATRGASFTYLGATGKKILLAFIAAALTLLLVVLLLTGARAAWLGAGTGVGAAWLGSGPLLRRFDNLSSPRRGRPWHLPLLAFVLLGAIVAAFLLRIKLPSAYGRWQIYRIDWLILKQNLWAGIGFGQLSAQFNEYQASYFSAQPRPLAYQLLAADTFEAFNSVLQLGAEAGLLGAGAACCLLYLVWNTLGRRMQPTAHPALAIGAAASVVGTGVASLLSNPFHHSPIAVNVVFLLALCAFRRIRLAGIFLQVARLALVVALPFAGYASYNELRRWQALRQWDTAISFVNAGHFDQARPFYARAAQRLRNHGFLLYNYGAESFIAGQPAQSIALLNRAKHFYTSQELYTYLGAAYAATAANKQAEWCYRHASAITPAHLYPKYQLLRLYRATGKPQHACVTAESILRYPVKIPSPATAQIQDSARALAKYCNP